MTDTDKLKRLARWCKTSGNHGIDPDEVRALIAENERLDGLVRQLTRSTYGARKQRDEAVALLRECWDQPMTPWGKVSAFLARIDRSR